MDKKLVAGQSAMWQMLARTSSKAVTALDSDALALLSYTVLPLSSCCYKMVEKGANTKWRRLNVLLPEVHHPPQNGRSGGVVKGSQASY